MLQQRCNEFNVARAQRTNETGETERTLEKIAHWALVGVIVHSHYLIRFGKKEREVLLNVTE